MKTKRHQLTGVIQYEMRLQWRRRVLLIIAVSFITLLFIALLIQRASLAAPARNLPPEMVTFAVLFAISPVSLMVMMIGLPPVLAETIPKDRQYGVDELLRSLPIGRGWYLAGKLLGTWASVLVMLVVAALLEWVMSLLLLGAVDLGAYLEVWLMGIGPLALFVSGMSVLLASRQPNRRRATMIGGLFTLYSIVMFPFFAAADFTWANAFNPSAWLLVIMRLLFQRLEADLAASGMPGFFPVVPMTFVWQTLAAAAIQVGVVWLLVWLWWRWREMRD